MRYSLKNFLEELELTPELFNKYLSCVVDSDYAETIGRYIYKTSKNNTWSTVTRRDLTPEVLKRIVARHLLRKDFYAGISCSDKTKHLIIDLDYHNSLEELNKRCDKVIEAVRDVFGRPNVILRSSDKGGRHLRWLLSNPLDRRKIHNLVKSLLLNNGITLKKGTVELFPGLNHKSIRLPLGIGGAILDGAYNVVWDGSTPISHALTIYTTYCKQKVNILRVVGHPLWGVAPIQSKAVATGDASSRIQSQEDNDNPFSRSENHWLVKGLTGAKQKLRAITDLAIYYWHNGYTKEEAIALIQNWLRLKHNHKSKDYNVDPHKELNVTIPETVAFIFDSAEAQNFRRKNVKSVFEDKHLTAEDGKKILALSDDFNEQLWLYSLLTYIKTHATNGYVVLHCLTLNELRGCSMNTRTALVALATKLGIIELEEEYDKDRGKARLYKVNWAFAEDQNVATYEHFEQFLIDNFKYTELVKKYNRYRAMSIRNYVDGSVNCGIINNRVNSVKETKNKESFSGSTIWELWQNKNSNGYQNIQSSSG